MKVENQSDLEKLIKLMRKTGVKTLKAGEIHIELSDYEPQQSAYMRKKQKKSGQLSNDTPKVDHQFTEEQILMWSSTPPGMEPTEN